VRIKRIFKQNELWAVVSGILLTASFPKIDLSLSAWFALVPLLICLSRLSPGSGFRIGFLAGVSHFLTLMYWLVHTMQIYGYLPWYLSVAILFLLACYLALFFALFSYALIRLCRTPLSFFILTPVLWVALEYVRSFLLSGLPWELIGYSQYRLLPILQGADVFGVYGLSFLILLSNAAVSLVFLSLTGKTWKGAGVSKRFAAACGLVFIICFSLTWVYGKHRLQTVEQWAHSAPTAKVAVVQGNIDQAVKWDHRFQNAVTEKYIRMSRTVGKQSPDLIVWPETATPFYLKLDPEPSEKLFDGVKEIGIDFLLGSPFYTQRKDRIDYYNRAYLVRADGSIGGKYDKVHLVPFGEYIPFEAYIPFLGKMVAEVGDFVPGRKGSTIPWRGHRLGMQICFEIIFPNLSRKMTQNGAELLINITNDAWFGRTGASFQHFSMAAFRAVENRRALVRAANTGISGFIDPTGRTMAATRLFEDATQIQTVPLLSQKTLYTRWGDLLAMVCLAVALIWAGVKMLIVKMS
jgi:apolipoprotein N-acyltransferase